MDAPILPDLLEQIPPDQQIATVTADGAYDTRRCHNVITARGAAAIIPRAKMPNPGNQPRRVLSRETKP